MLTSRFMLIVLAVVFVSVGCGGGNKEAVSDVAGVDQASTSDGTGNTDTVTPDGLSEVTGSDVDSRTAWTISRRRVRSRMSAAPDVDLTTFLTGHPELMSMTSGRIAATRRVASAIDYGRLPKSWKAIGRSSS